MNNHSLNNQKNIDIPAISCSLENGYLIEASAGTGKTWTLTGILLRLLIEKKYPPEKIIATTFTRMAAAEMQERLQQRLNNFYQYITWIQSKKQKYPDWFSVGFNENIKIDDIIEQIKENALKEEVKEYDDAINIHLIKLLLTNTQNNHELELTIRRVSLILSTLDKLFIGTIDSLTQKWLKEFSSEISYNIETKIINNQDEIIDFLIHDELRKHHYQISQDSPILYKILDKSIFSDVNSIANLVELSLNFYTADIDEPEHINDLYVNSINDFLQDFLNKDLSVFQVYYDVDTRKKIYGFNANNIITKKFHLLENIIEKIKLNHIEFVQNLTVDEKKLIERFKEIDSDKLFKKDFTKQKDQFHLLPINYLKELSFILDKIYKLKEKYKIYLYSHIAKCVKLKMKNYLEKTNQSTFTFQMVRLNEALKENKELSRYIRFLYPIALIDESQDISSLQFELIKSIYLEDLQDKDENKVGTKFLLLVGDPKQAIYHFRGGDVANYNQAKFYGKNHEDIQSHPILDSSLILKINHRSNSEMIHALNNWFFDNNKIGFENHANLGDDIFYQKIYPNNDKKNLYWQNQLENKDIPDYLTDKKINIIFSRNENDGSKKDEEENIFLLVANHINSILNMNAEIEINGIRRKIESGDIAILAKNHDTLSKINSFLKEKNINAVLPKSINIFKTKAAKDLYNLILAIMDNNKNKISSMLISSFFNLNLEKVDDIIKNENYYNKIISYLKIAKINFKKYGISSLLNYCLFNNPISDLEDQENSLWKQAAKQGERYVADLWQLIEIIGNRHNLRNIHELHFISWFESMLEGDAEDEVYKQLPLPSEVGINLMTIHRSKGLEFPIVYIFGLDDPASISKNIFYPYIKKDGFYVSRHISADKESENYTKYKNENMDELRRLGYVALTRASEQTFVVVKKIKTNSPLSTWFEIEDNSNNNFTLPERLINHVGKINLSQCKDFINENYQCKQIDQELISYSQWDDIFYKQEFFGSTNISASSLINQLKDSDEYQANYDMIEYISKDYDKKYHYAIYKSDDIRVHFEKGKYIGTFLHKLLQEIQVNNIEDISNKISQYIKKQNIAKEYDKDKIENHQKLIHWIMEIINTPMKSSEINLSSLSYKNYMKELGFLLGINDSFSIQKLNHIFRKSGKNIFISEDDSNYIHKYLKGEIDLVYEYQNKFYIVDYKSNFISHFLHDYNEENLSKIMDQQGYWLQACIYQLALHKLLKLRIKDYYGNEKQYLGAIEFIFLRGVDKEHTDLGRICWDVPINLLYELDELFN